MSRDAADDVKDVKDWGMGEPQKYTAEIILEAETVYENHAEDHREKIRALNGIWLARNNFTRWIEPLGFFLPDLLLEDSLALALLSLRAILRTILRHLQRYFRGRRR